MPNFSLGAIGSPCCPCSPTPTPTPTCTCSPCDLPAQSLTVTTVGLFTTWTTTATYGGSCSDNWVDDSCTTGSIITLACVSGSVKLTIKYFISGGCPDGQSLECSNNSDGGTPVGLTLVSCTESPFSLKFVPTPGSTCGSALGNYISWTFSLPALAKDPPLTQAVATTISAPLTPSPDAQRAPKTGCCGGDPYGFAGPDQPG
jgi:hypothetical protein